MLNYTLSFSASRKKLLLKESVALFRHPKDLISIYNEDAYDGLVSKLVKARKYGQNFTVVGHGDFKTAGGGATSWKNAYYFRFADLLNLLLSSQEET